MNVKRIHHIWYYAGLVVIFLLTLFLIASVAHDIRLQMFLVIFMSVFYVGWALLHHFIHHDLHAKIVIEYVLLGAVGISMVYFAVSLLK